MTAPAVSPHDIVRVIDGGGDAHLAVVRSVHDRHVTIWLVHSMREWATGDDVLVPPAGDRKYPLVVHLGLLGCVWRSQVDGVVGALPGGWQDGERGMRLLGPLDARWSFLEGQLEVLQRMTADCTAALLDESAG